MGTAAEGKSAIERSVTVGRGGLKLAVREWPGRDPPILLLHGLASTSRIFDLLAPRLAGRHRVVAYDQRGHGGSGKPASGYGFEHLAADARAVIRRLDLDRPILVGHSWGANVALEVGIRYRRDVPALVLTDGGFHNLADEFDWPTAREAMTPPPLAGMPVQAFLEVARARMKGQFAWTSAHDDIVLSLMRVDRSGRIRPRLSLRNHLKIIRAMWEQDTVGLVRRLQLPTLLMLTRLRGEIPGEQTAVWTEVKRRAAAEIRRMNGSVRVEWIEGIHDVPIQAPERVARRILRFVAEIAPA